MAKIILTQEVSGLGAAGDVVEVKNGYARNYLMPRGLATVWSKGGERQIESIRKAREARAQHNLEDAQAQAEKLSAATVTVPVNAGAEGRLFGTVKPAAIADAIQAAGLGSVDKRAVTIEKNIKRTGRHTVAVRLHEDVVASIEIDVVAS
ncbi:MULTISPECIES: 50S ribosomal protein L9 [Kocuria]|uniref:50S ribosomal protein L9 n=1 Tax=Kocuria TaxID=57493 RepID=UPI0006611560|nr:MULTISPECIES: 50S ribosomal protein L9 [Kocuria]MCT1367724.1 50S ribosomal protein L9 [Rothia sp. p3-SID1597]RUQ20278.1 50S ribosomal protein L9 [Kocuria sp. HSID16901]